MKRILIGVVLGLMIATGAEASQKVILTVHSNPEGARLLTNADQKQVGVTPFVLHYKFANWDACQRSTKITVVWASGASVSTDNLALCPSESPKQAVTYERPAGAPGLDLDINAAFQQALLTRLDRAAAAAAEAAIWNTPKRTMLCSSTRVGAIITTSCY
jgi:hypothetical protein